MNSFAHISAHKQDSLSEFYIFVALSVQSIANALERHWKRDMVGGKGDCDTTRQKVKNLLYFKPHHFLLHGTSQ